MNGPSSLLEDTNVTRKDLVRKARERSVETRLKSNLFTRNNEQPYDEQSQYSYAARKRVLYNRGTSGKEKKPVSRSSSKYKLEPVYAHTKANIFGKSSDTQS